MTPMFKISAACIAAVGAKTAEEFPEKLVALLNASATITEAFAKVKTDFTNALTTIEGLNAAHGTLNETVEAQAEEIKTLKSAVGNPNALTESKISEIATKAATIAGSAEAMKAIGATGNGAPPAPPANNGGDSKTAVAALIAAGKFEEAFALDKNAQAEFDNAKSYAHFMGAQGRGQVKITAKNQ